MITQILTAPVNVAAFQATGEIKKEDIEYITNVVASKVAQENELNYLLKLDTPISNFSLGAWMQDAWLGLKNLTKWNRCAIVTDKESIRTFTDLFSKVMIGEFRGFEQADYQKAEYWVATGKEI